MGDSQPGTGTAAEDGRSAALERARLLAARGEESAALAGVEAILESEPDCVPALLTKAGLLLPTRREEAALEVFARAAALAPRSAEALDGLARCLHLLGRDAQALAVALRARDELGRAENFAQIAPVYLTLVWIHRALRQYREALAAAEEGLDRCADGVLAQWASVVEEELAEAQQERC